MHSFPYKQFVLALLLGCFGLAQAAELTSTVNRNQLGPNETLSLTVSYDEQIDSSELDLAGLRTNFDVLSVRPQSSNSMSIVNGKTTRIASTVWSITLLPKREGRLLVPTFSVKGAMSKPITITVSSSGAVNSTDQALEVWVSSNAQSIVPGQQLIVEVEISAASNVSDLNGPQLVVANAEIEPLGQQSFQRVDNGVARQVIVLKYALFTSEPGKLTIPVMTYTGVKGGRQSIFGRRGQQVFARSEQLEIQVLKKPNSESKPWFPAENVSVKSRWSGDKNQVRAGEPITRSIEVSTLGQRASAIPPIVDSGDLTSYKRYKDQAKLDNRVSENGIVSTRVESEAIVPNQSGELTLAAIDVDWWNVKTKRWQTTTLPEETISVLPALSTTQPTQQFNAPQDSSMVPASSLESPRSVVSHGYWKLLSAALALVVLLQGMAIWSLWNRKASAPSNEGNALKAQSEASAWRQLTDSCKSGKASDIRRDLLDWYSKAADFSGSLSLQTLGAESEKLKSELLKLDQHLYNRGDDFNAAALTSLLKSLRKDLQNRQQLKTESQGKLRELYPA